MPQLDRLPLDVTAGPGSARGSRKALTWHTAGGDFSVAYVGGLATTDLERTWLDLAGVLPLPWQVAVTDVILRRLKHDELLVPPGQRGAANLRTALALANPRTRSARESLLRVNLVLAGAPAPEINLDIIEDGVWLATGDLVWSEYRFIVEYDGIDHTSLRQRHKDANTRGELSARGWTVQPLTAIHFQHLERTVQMVLDRLRAKGWRG